MLATTSSTIPVKWPLSNPAWGGWLQQQGGLGMHALARVHMCGLSAADLRFMLTGTDCHVTCVCVCVCVEKKTLCVCVCVCVSGRRAQCPFFICWPHPCPYFLPHARNAGQIAPGYPKLVPITCGTDPAPKKSDVGEFLADALANLKLTPTQAVMTFQGKGHVESGKCYRFDILLSSCSFTDSQIRSFRIRIK